MTKQYKIESKPSKLAPMLDENKPHEVRLVGDTYYIDGIAAKTFEDGGAVYADNGVDRVKVGD